MKKKKKYQARDFIPECKYNGRNKKAQTTMDKTCLEKPNQIDESNDGT